jgi:hypothetical protein
VVTALKPNKPVVIPGVTGKEQIGGWEDGWVGGAGAQWQRCLLTTDARLRTARAGQRLHLPPNALQNIPPPPCGPCPTP